MLLFLFLESAFSQFSHRGSECKPCIGDDFDKYPTCHKTGYILSYAKKNLVQPCSPTLSKTYFSALKVLLILLIVDINLIIIIRLRKNCLLQNRYD